MLFSIYELKFSPWVVMNAGEMPSLVMMHILSRKENGFDQNYWNLKEFSNVWGKMASVIYSQKF